MTVHSGRRSKLEIKIGILRACATPISKTNLMFAVRVCWSVLQLHLKELTKGGYLKFTPAGPHEGPSLQGRILGWYSLTIKGEKALIALEAFNEGLLK